MKKRIPAVILMFALFLSTSFAANIYSKSINVEYGIKVLIDNEYANMTDVNGNSVEPFVYEGTTYVPIRAVAENLGADISYNSELNWAQINDTKYSEKYLYFLLQASNAASVIQSYNMSYLAMWLGNVELQGRFYDSASGLVGISHDFKLTDINTENPYYSKAQEIDHILSTMLSDFADLEDAYYNSNKDTFDDLYDKIQDGYNKITAYSLESHALTY